MKKICNVIFVIWEKFMNAIYPIRLFLFMIIDEIREEKGHTPDEGFHGNI